MRSGRRVPVRFLDFGIWETFFVPLDPAGPCRARSQTVLLDRARFQNSSPRSSSHAGDVPHSSSIREEFAQIDFLCDFLHRVVRKLERDINLDTDVIGLFLSKDGELGTELKKVPFRHFLIEFLRKEVDNVLCTVTNGKKCDVLSEIK